MIDEQSITEDLTRPPDGRQRMHEAAASQESSKTSPEPQPNQGLDLHPPDQMESADDQALADDRSSTESSRVRRLAKRVLERAKRRPEGEEPVSSVGQTAARVVEAARKKTGDAVGGVMSARDTISAQVLQAKTRAAHVTAVVKDAVVAQGEAAGAAASEAARRAATRSATAVKSVSGEVAGGLQATASSVVETSSAAGEHVSSIGRAATDAVAGAPSRLMGVFLRECTVPAFLLPTGSLRGDFHCVFQFEEVVEKLHSGILVRPVIEVWAGRDDFDRGRLAAILRDEFTSQLGAERERVRQRDVGHVEAEVQRLRDKQASAGAHVEAAATVFGSSLLLMFFVANPLFNLLFLLIAIFTGTTGTVRAFSYVMSAAGIRGERRAAKRELKDLEDALDAKNEAFEAAVKHLTVRVHPLLADLVADYSDLDDRPYFSSSVAPAENAPSAVRHLNSEAYRMVLPPYYAPLLNMRLSSGGQ